MVKRVAVIAYHTSPLLEPGSGDAGGMTVYIRELSAALASLGVRTDIFTRASSPFDKIVEISEGVRVVPIDAGPREPLGKEELPAFVDDFVASVRAFSLTQRIAYDVIHSHYWQSGMAGKGLAAVWDVPLVHSFHTLAKVKNSTLAPGDVPEPESRLQGEQQVIAAADVLIASTDEEYQALACMYRADHDRLKTLPPGVDHERFSPGHKAEARVRLDLPPDRPIAVSVGRIQKLKGLELAIRTMAVLRTEGLGAEPLLVIVGGASGPGGEGELARLKVLTGELDLEDNVMFIGPQPHSQLADLYRSADVTLICSYSESFGLTVLEAQASGTPVIGTGVGGPTDAVIDGVSGYVIGDRHPASFARRIAGLISDPALADSFSRAAREASLPYSWKATAENLVTLYECLMQERSPEACTC